jgi:hypothetical protein
MPILMVSWATATCVAAAHRLTEAARTQGHDVRLVLINDSSSSSGSICIRRFHAARVCHGSRKKHEAAIRPRATQRKCDGTMVPGRSNRGRVRICLRDRQTFRHLTSGCSTAVQMLVLAGIMSPVGLGMRVPVAHRLAQPLACSKVCAAEPRTSRHYRIRSTHADPGASGPIQA